MPPHAIRRCCRPRRGVTNRSATRRLAAELALEGTPAAEAEAWPFRAARPAAGLALSREKRVATGLSVITSGLHAAPVSKTELNYTRLSLYTVTSSPSQCTRRGGPAWAGARFAEQMWLAPESLI